MSKIKMFEDYNSENDFMEFLIKYHKTAQKYSEKSGKLLSEIKPIETLIGTFHGFYYDGNIIFLHEDTIVLQKKGLTDPNWIHEIAEYEIGEI